MNSRRIQVSNVARVQQALFATGFSGDSAKISDESMLRFQRITKESHGVRRIGSGALISLCSLRAFRRFWEKPINPWDIAAGVLILQEAGGQVSGVSGQELDLFAGEVVGTNGKLHNELIERLQV